MASMYSAKVMEHFANPHNVGELPDANGVGEVGNPKCGDIMRMYLKIENNVIQDVRFLTFVMAQPLPPAVWPPTLSRARPLMRL